MKVYILLTLLFCCDLPRSGHSSCSLNRDETAEEVEVLILGGGIAGISAGRTLEVNGISDFLVLEATDRIGGRIREFDGTNIEVGANWIHGLDPADPKHHPIWREWLECDKNGPGGSYTPGYAAVYDKDGIELIQNQTGQSYSTRNAQFLTAYDYAFDLDASKDVSVRQGLVMGDWEPITSLDNFIDWTYVDLEYGVGPENISLVILGQESSYTDFTESDEAEDYLLVDDKGFSFVVKCLARNFINDRIKLNTTVTKIRVADDCVCAEVQGGGMYCGVYGIVTFSIGVLQAAVRGDQNSIVQFDPPLPQWKEDAINQITPVHYGKIFLVFPARFWDEGEEDQQILGYVSDIRGYYGYIILDKNRPNTITIDVTEDLAQKIATQTEEETVNEVLAVLGKIFNNVTIPQPERVVISKWHLDPLFLHAFSISGPGVPETVFEELRKPVNGRLYFAGEAVNDTAYGTTHGGYGTGATAANRIVEESDSTGSNSGHTQIEVTTSLQGVYTTVLPQSVPFFGGSNVLSATKATMGCVLAAVTVIFFTGF